MFIHVCGLKLRYKFGIFHTCSNKIWPFVQGIPSGLRILDKFMKSNNYKIKTNIQNILLPKVRIKQKGIFKVVQFISKASWPIL